MTNSPIRVILREQVNKLESNKFSNSSILECFKSLKTTSEWEKHDQQQFLLLLEQIILNADLDWLSSSYSKTLVLDIFSKVQPDLKLLALTSFLYNFKHGCRLDFVIELIQQFFVLGCYKELILKQTQVSSDISQQTWEKLITCISSLPDQIANKFDSKKSFPLFHHERFFLFIGVQVVEIIEKLVENVKQGLDIDVTFLSYNLGQYCLCGKTEFLFKTLFPALVARCRTCFIWQRVSHKLFQKLPDRCLDKVLLHLFKQAPNYYCLKYLLSDILLESPKAKFIVLHKLLLTYSSSNCIVAQNVIGFLSLFKSTFPFITEVLQKLLVVWSSSSSIKRTSYEQHRYVTSAILTCAVHLKDKLDSKTKSDLTNHFMGGVKNHLDSPEERVRLLGMIVAEKLTELVKFTDQKEKLTFEYRSTEESKFLLSLSELSPEPKSEFYDKQMSIFKKIRDNLENLDVNYASEVDYGVDKSSFIKMAEIQRINLKPVDGEQESNNVNSSSQSEASDLDSDDDDLVPFDIPEEKPFSQVSRPLYIRDCMDGLIENKDRHHMEVYLDCISQLINADKFASKEVSVELCRILLNLQDTYAIEGFFEVRRKAIVTILMCDPEAVSGLITNEFYTENYNIMQRIDMLDTLVMAAGKMSGLDKAESSQQAASVEENNSDLNQSLSWEKVVEKRIESKTRRFGKGRKNQLTAPNQFGPVAGCFFFPLMAGYDRRIRTLDLLGTDSMLLGRLLYALGTILYANTHSTTVERMAFSLLEFVAQMRRHTEPSVRKACIYCISMTTLAVRALTERLGDVALDARDWLCDVVAHDDDMKAREMASNTIALINGKVRKELGMDESK